MWHHHQNQLHYRHVEEDDTQSVQISDSTVTSPIMGGSPPVILIMRGWKKMLKQLLPISLRQQMKVQGKHIIGQYGTIDLRKDTPE